MLKPTAGTHLSMWANFVVGLSAYLLNDTSWLQMLGSKSGYVLAGVSMLNGALHAVTGNAPIVGVPPSNAKL